jgi:LPXTG-site transpeptidase (sortase) family protein
MLAVAVIVVSLGAFATLAILHSNRSTVAQISALSNQPINSNNVQTSKPSTIKPSAAAIASYKVPLNMPRYLNISSLGVHAPITSLDLTLGAFSSSPDNVYDVGWYSGSSLPGESGAVLLIGHVETANNPGVFSNINKLKPGDKIQVVRGDGIQYTYQVIETQIYKNGDPNMTSALAPIVSTSQGLNIMSSPGDTIPGASSANERMVVYTILLV